MKPLQNPKNQFIAFIVFFFILNVIQSYYTGLINDEYYYWVWSKKLAFGYFDHPPLVALWIKISSLFFNGSLGVRFFSTITFSIAIIFIWKCIDYEEKWQYVWLFFLLIVSVALLNFYGFITVPDTPLLLFTALFLYAYKSFLKHPSWKTILFLGVTMAGLVYSKYHGILIIMFTILSNLKLLKNKQFWLAAFLGALLFLPHLYWQVQEGFPSVKYHLLERSKKQYRFEFTLMHFVNLIAIVGLTFPIVYAAFFKQKAKNIFEKSLQYIVYGFIVFFTLSTFKTSTQAQWSGSILIPIIIFTFGYFVEHNKARKWLIYLGMVNLVFLIIARIFLASEKLSPFELETHWGEQWAKNIKHKTKSRPIVFIGSYKDASKYNYFTGITTDSYSTLQTRKSQYNLYNFEKNMQHKNITVVNSKISGYKIYSKGKDTLFGKDINNYTTFQKVTCTLNSAAITLVKNKTQKINFTIFNPYKFDISFDNVSFVGVFQGEKNAIIKEVPLNVNKNFILRANTSKKLTAELTLPKKLDISKILTFRIALRFYELPPGFEGNKVNVTFKNE